MPTSTFPFLSLPQELRDQIYEYHLSGTYHHCLPNTCKIRKSPSIDKNPHFETPQQRQHCRLAILLVSKSVREEATLAFYKCGTFVFEVIKATTSLPRSLIDTTSIQNIIIDVDWDVVLSSSAIENGTAKSATDLVKNFAQLNTTLTRRSCVVRIHFLRNASFLLDWTGETKAFLDAICALTGFGTVSVKIAYVRWKRREWFLSSYMGLGTYLEGGLGKKEVEWDDEMWFSLTYHPLDGRVGRGLGDGA